MPVKDDCELVDGVIESAGVFKEFTDREVIKIVKLLTITRTPDTLIAQVNLQTGDGIRDIAIGEQFVRAMVKVFDDFRKEHPDGKAEKAPRGTFASQADAEAEEAGETIAYEG